MHSPRQIAYKPSVAARLPATIPLLGRSKKRNQLGEVPPWEKQPGYWETPHGRLAMERRGAIQIAEMHPEAVLHIERVHAAEQYAAAAGPAAARPQFANSPLSSTCSDQTRTRRGARKFAEAHPEIVNHYAKCNGSCEDSAIRHVGKVCDGNWTSNHPPFSPRVYDHPVHKHVRNTMPQYNDTQETPRASEYGLGAFCDACQDYPHFADRDSPPYRGPVLMDTTCMPGRDGLLHHQSCLQAQAAPFCWCHDCDDRRRRLVGGPAESYVRQRPRDWEREV